MQKLLMLLFCAVVLSSCEKHAQKNPEPDFELRLAKMDDAGVTRALIVDRAINSTGSAVSTPRYTVKQGSIELNMGIIPGTTVVPRLKSTIIFKQTANPAAVTGIYRLPNDADKIHFSFSESINAQTIIRDLAVSGSVEVSYDAKTQTLNGKLIDIRYNGSLGSEHKAYVLNGWFNHAAIER